MDGNFKKIVSFLGAVTLSFLAACGKSDVGGIGSESDPTEEGHEHVFSQFYAYDDLSHWHEAICGHSRKSGEERHDFTDWIPVEAPSATSGGEEMKRCIVCNYTVTRETGRGSFFDGAVSDTSGPKTFSCGWAYGNNDLDTALTPIWEGNTVYNETVTFADKEDMPTLLYAPTEILSVCDYARTTEYVEGKDFIVEGNKIRLTERTAIPYWGSISPEETLYSDSFGSIRIASRKFPGKYVFYSETVPNRYQICVTYRHDSRWTGFAPQGNRVAFPKTLGKLEQGGNLSVGVLGDSITFGRGSSSDVNTFKPHPTPCYASLVGEYLTARYPDANIVYDNQGVGGTTASWGKETGLARFRTIPDLLIVAFGMNDDGGSSDYYENNIRGLIVAARDRNPACEILLVSSMLDNPDRADHDCHLPAFEERLEKIASETPSVGVAKMTSMCQYLYTQTGVRFEDVNSNNYNHPNDFTHRLYAQVILKTLLADGYVSLK